MLIRTATIEDLESVTEVERSCFPSTEAATEEIFAERLRCYGNHFLLMFDGNKLISFVDGLVTDERDLTDSMFENADMHNENGDWQMIFGVNTLPEYRNRGYAGQLLQRMIEEARKRGRKGVVLTCKPKLVGYYAKFGFADEGITDKSSHGGEIWHQMRIVF